MLSFPVPVRLGTCDHCGVHGVATLVLGFDSHTARLCRACCTEAAQALGAAQEEARLDY